VRPVAPTSMGHIKGHGPGRPKSAFFPKAPLSASGSHPRHHSLPSTLRYNSPTKKFGYARWPALLSPTYDVDQVPVDDYAEVR
jgi:hypothetical protein